MYQSFEDRSEGGRGAERLAALRAAMREAGVDGFVIPRADAHQGETVAPRDERLAWLTGFTGSAGLCVALAERAALFVDGRYTLQARAQVDGHAFEIVPLADRSPEDWLADALQEGATLGLDPMLHPAAAVERYEKAAAKAGAQVKALDANLVDAVWEDQPPPPAAAIRPHPAALAGEAAAAKRARIGEEIARAGAAAAVLTLPDSIAWLLNIRGADVPRTPAPLCFALIDAGGAVTLFCDEDKVDGTLLAHLGNGVSVAAPETFGPALDGFGGRSVWVDRDSAPAWVGRRLASSGATTLWKRDPCILPKATKTEAELAGARAAHLRDAAAMARFLHWLSVEGPKGELDEIAVVKALEAFRAGDGTLRDIAFDTICGAGEHGAIVHYRVTRETNRPIRTGELLLVDSGGQYEDGTTDITRTIAIGAPEPEARRLFTLVLKGMIAVSRARFPAKTTGRELDPMARAALWSAGQDFDHGTGHGVGAYLGVHEGPQSISRRGAEPLLPGMILSNEPGCYLEGRFGIRIENLVVVTEAAPVGGGPRPMHGFETLTWAPIDRALIDPELLDPEERAWLDAYHAEVARKVAPLVEPEVAAWLEKACAPL
jgi:Xaa-Pro aminopeptidase